MPPPPANLPIQQWLNTLIPGWGDRYAAILEEFGIAVYGEIAEYLDDESSMSASNDDLEPKLRHAGMKRAQLGKLRRALRAAGASISEGVPQRIESILVVREIQT